jgi:hypothetical protein
MESNMNKLLYFMLLTCATLVKPCYDCCDRNLSKLDKAISASNFKKVRHVLSDQNAIFVNLPNSSNLASQVTSKRLQVANHYRLNEGKGQLGAGFVGLGITGLIVSLTSVFNTHNESQAEASEFSWHSIIHIVNSLTALGIGTKLFLNGLFKWQEENDLASAIAIETLLKEKQNAVNAPQSYGSDGGDV